MRRKEYQQPIMRVVMTAVEEDLLGASTVRFSRRVDELENYYYGDGSEEDLFLDF